MFGKFCLEASSVSYRERFSLRVLFLALVILVAGALLMLHSVNMLFKMDPLAVFIVGLAAVLVFSGIALIIIGVAGLASV